MGQFRFLKRLLLVHGHWNYQRVGYLVLYNFYRNAVFVLMLFWYVPFFVVKSELFEFPRCIAQKKGGTYWAISPRVHYSFLAELTDQIRFVG
ncbi:hypothetical protein Gotur_032179 [Gossypium turneri]